MRPSIAHSCRRCTWAHHMVSTDGSMHPPDYGRHSLDSRPRSHEQWASSISLMDPRQQPFQQNDIMDVHKVCWLP